MKFPNECTKFFFKYFIKICPKFQFLKIKFSKILKKFHVLFFTRKMIFFIEIRNFASELEIYLQRYKTRNHAMKVDKFSAVADFLKDFIGRRWALEV